MKTKFIVKREFYEGATETAQQILERLILQAAQREMRENRHDTPVDVCENKSKHGIATN